MSTNRGTLVFAVVAVLLTSTAWADKFKGYLWQVTPSSIVVDGQPLGLDGETKVERSNQNDITTRDLRVGWEVEVDAREYGTGLVARHVRVVNGRNQEETIEGVVDSIEKDHFSVDGELCRLAKGVTMPDMKLGMLFKGKGIRLDDRSIEVKEGRAESWGQEEEAQYMAACEKEVAQMQRQLKVIHDPQLQAYIDKVGHSLVPKWIDPQQVHFTFTLVADPTLNAFALPDGTVVIHSGLVAVLENEAQLATVLGHEITHVTHHHGYRGYKDQQSKQKWVGLGSMLAGAVVGAKTQNNSLAGLVTGTGSQLALQAAVNGHGRKFEDQADIVGLHYMVDAGYDYMEAPEVWHVFSKYVKDQSAVSNWFFSDHSTHDARIKNLTRAINADYRGHVSRTNLRTAEPEYQQAVAKLASDNATANMGNKEYTQAARGFAAAVDRNPSDAVAQYNLGRVLWAQGGVRNAQQALDAYAEAVRLDPTMAAPWRDIGEIFYEVRDVNHAAQAFQKYLELDPNAPEAPQIRAFLDSLRTQ
jgi:predicted Zn-dependent protease